MRAVVLFLLALLFSGAVAPAASQPIADTLFSWRGYTQVSQSHLQLYPGPPGDENRDHTVVLRELADNNGPSTLDDIGYVAEQVGREFGMDPARVFWIVHWGAFSYVHNATSSRDVLIRVTFRRTSTGRLSAPYWRVITHSDLRDLTANRYRSPL
ncbi:MAG: hypothetical protein PPP56_00570 [Longimonas sp.]|uniref:hypothetical protein n=1 Tax=Longimonas sp. TaxID=2039626 RepID=UPI0033582537